MASPTTFRTPYDLRIELVKDTITAHSKLRDGAAGDLAGATWPGAGAAVSLTRRPRRDAFVQMWTDLSR